MMSDDLPGRPGAAAREVARRVGPSGHVLAVDRSAKAIDQLVASANDLIEAGVLSVRAVACEELVLDPHDRPYDLAFAVRVGAFDGRQPDAGAGALHRLALQPRSRWPALHRWR